MPFENGMLSEMLVDQGYNTFCIGKWHLSPSEDNTPAGPFHRWPLGRGFERFYGFLGGETNQWYPDLTQDNGSVRQPSLPEDGYHLSEDLADQAIKLILDAHVNAPEKPFFMYYATGAAHAPHHVPKEWADRYAGKFDLGWDAYRETVFARQKEIGLVAADAELSPHDPDVPEWDSLNDDERRLYARMMEVFAGFVSHADHHFGRILDTLERIGELDNTIIMIISDNGASAEGGVTGSFNEMLFFNMVPESFEDNLAKIDELGGTKAYNHYPWGWTWAGNTPFRRWKRETYRGGSTDPFVVSWPAGMAARGEVRTQYAHAIDMVPTVLEAIGVDRTRDDPRGSRSRRRGGQLRPHLRRRGRADPAHHAVLRDVRPSLDRPRRLASGVPWPGPSFAESAELGRKLGDTITPAVLDQLDPDGWELYHIVDDPTESHDVAADHPDRLRELVALWWSEAEKYKVLPLDGSLQPRLAAERPQTSKARSRFVYYPNASVVPAFAAPPTYNRPYSVEADVEIPPVARRASWSRRAATPVASACTWKTAGSVRLQLLRTRRVRGRVLRPGPRGPPHAPLRVRADRCAGHPGRKGHARPRTALRRRRAGRQHRIPAHDPAAVRAGGAQLRIRLRCSGRRRLRASVRVHRHDPLGHLRRLRGPDQGRGGRDRPDHGPAVEGEARGGRTRRP